MFSDFTWKKSFAQWNGGGGGGGGGRGGGGWSLPPFSMALWNDNWLVIVLIVILSHLILKNTCQECVYLKSVLSSLRKGKLNKLVSAHLNINFIINEFDCLPKQVKENFEILLV